MTTDSITSLAAYELADRISDRELSSREVVDAHIARIEEVNPTLNAIVVPLFEEARAEADAADEAIRRGDAMGSLHGVPITVKEMYDVAGTPTTAGIHHLAKQLAVGDAVLVARLRRAGAIILGKTNVAQLGLMLESDNPLYGRTNNPWNVERSSSGSSGGEAAIIAAGGSPLGLGSDGGGSIRQPAHVCGICGIKPTSGRLDMRGHYVLPSFPRGFNHGGPLARCVTDLELALQALASSEPSNVNPQVAPTKIGDPSSVDISSLRIGTYTDDGYLAASPALGRAVHEACDRLHAGGATIEEFQVPDIRMMWRLFCALVNADGGHFVRRALQRSLGDWRIKRNLMLTAIPNLLRPLARQVLLWQGDRYMSDLIEFIPRRVASAPTLIELHEQAELYRQQFGAALDRGRYDVIICPPSAIPAPKHGIHVTSFAMLYTGLYNFLGMPAGVVPATRVRAAEESDRVASRDTVVRAMIASENDSAGLPVGVQVVSRHWREDIVLAVMRNLEEHFREQVDYPHTPVVQ